VADLRHGGRAHRRDGGLLHGSGIRIERITRLVSELNRRLFARLWALLAPAELVANSCLLVMGSEGRGEQILKTDQDNALLLRDGFEYPGLADVAARFNAALAEFGYPPCPGDIMLTNPLWRQPLAAFRDTLRGWIYGHEPTARCTWRSSSTPPRWPATPACCARRATTSTASCRGRTSTWRALPRRPTSSRARQLVEAADHQARRTAAGPEEAGHLPHRARRARAGAAVRRARTGHGGAAARLVGAAASTRWRATCWTRCTPDGLRLSHQLRQRAKARCRATRCGRPS
jgi:hypothetical protein